MDLLARSPAGVVTIIEVKTARADHDLAHLPSRQARRLMRVAAYLAQRGPVQMLVAFAEEDRVRLVPVDGLTGI